MASRRRGAAATTQQQSSTPRNHSPAPPAPPVPLVDLGPPLIIAVVGATGSGKSTFINLLAQSDFPVGNELRSCTQDPVLTEPFEVGGRLVTLLDTPGFDDTLLSDSEVLRRITVVLNEMRVSFLLLWLGERLTYMDYRIGGTSRRNFDIFQKMCGEEAMKNVALVTNMWDPTLVDLNVAEARHEELMDKEIFFRPAIVAGAQVHRHNNTPQSGQAIIRSLLENTPLPLQIQRELRDEGRNITETTAGAELLRELTEMTNRHRREIDEIQREMQDAIRERDFETQRELERARNEALENQRRAEEERSALVSHFDQQRRVLEDEMRRIRRAFQEEADARSAQAKTSEQIQISQQQRAIIMREHNERLRAHLVEMQQRHNGSSGIPLSNIILPAVTVLLTLML